MSLKNVSMSLKKKKKKIVKRSGRCDCDADFWGLYIWPWETLRHREDERVGREEGDLIEHKCQQFVAVQQA